MNTTHDTMYLQQALAAAECRRGFCAPNPAVGAVVVKNDQVIATGTHWGPGQPHAEVEALRQAGDAAQGATLYVTLEPCCHYGKTPPCTDLIIQSNIKRVVFGFCDPNSVAANGRDLLCRSGIECDLLSTPEITTFYRSYAYWLKHWRPWVTLKLAISADHKIAAEDGKPAIITGEACYQFTQKQRAHSDAILTTVRTILNDDPKMNARLLDKTIAKPIFILDSYLQLDHKATIFKTAKSITVYHRDDVPPRSDLNCVAMPYDNNGLQLAAVLLDIGRRGVHDLWVEVGAHAFRSFYLNKLINQMIFYRSEKILGESALSAFKGIDPLRSLEWQRLGEDWFAITTART